MTVESRPTPRLFATPPPTTRYQTFGNPIVQGNQHGGHIVFTGVGLSVKHTNASLPTGTKGKPSLLLALDMQNSECLLAYLVLMYFVPTTHFHAGTSLSLDSFLLDE